MNEIIFITLGNLLRDHELDVSSLM